MNLLKEKSRETGYLKVILGPMFSGKTTELIKIYNSHKACGINVCAINHCSDTRYHDNKLSTHDRDMIDSINLNKLSLISPLLHMYDVFVINEGQFFDDLYDIINIMVNLHKKKVYVAGLDGDFKRRKFGQMLDIISLADDVIKLKSICINCKKKDGIFTHRLSNEQQQILVGSSNNYTSLCRHCYNLKNSISPQSKS
tara:strand:- start:2296 stop:2889 length:594 start_codon:yes stop_codon:yes gene_type:complete